MVIEKSSEEPLAMPCRCSSSAVTSAETVAMSSWLAALTPIVETLLLPTNSSRAVESGTMTSSSSVPVPPLDCKIPISWNGRPPM